MRKIDIRKLRIRPVSIDQISDRMLIVNLYVTQALTLIIGLIWVFLQGRNPLSVFALPNEWQFVYWGGGLAAIVLAADLLLSRWIPAEASDDGGVNERLFRTRPLWHIGLIAAIVSVCEELLFRGAIQYSIGPYWTSIVFAAIHVRYLRHWIPTGLVFSISYGLGWIQWTTGTIWAPIAAHFLIDLIMGCIIRYRRKSA
jgi:membrane protease YdiL (CAAX protease family)